MKTLITNLAVFVFKAVTIWTILSIVTTLVFCTVYTMNPSDPDFIIHTKVMNMVNSIMLLPSLYIATK